jgi:hypothetical protein
MPVDAFIWSNAPTTAEGRHVGDCESKVYMQTRLLSDFEASSYTIDGSAEPFPAQTFKPTESLLDF